VSNNHTTNVPVLN